MLQSLSNGLQNLATRLGASMHRTGAQDRGYEETFEVPWDPAADDDAGPDYYGATSLPGWGNLPPAWTRLTPRARPPVSASPPIATTQPVSVASRGITAHPITWPDGEEPRAPLRSYGDVHRLYSAKTLSNLGRAIQITNINPARQEGVRPLSPTRVSVAPLSWYDRNPHVTTPVAPLHRCETNVTAEQAKGLQLMQMVISAARALMPYCDTQLVDQEKSNFLSFLGRDVVRDLTAADKRHALDRLDPSRLDRSIERSSVLADHYYLASCGAGGTGEWASFCYYTLASLPEMKPYRVSQLINFEAQRSIVTVEIDGRTFVCDPWPTFPMAAPADHLMPNEHQAFFAPDNTAFVLRSKEPGERLTRMPMRDLAGAAERNAGFDANRSYAEQRYGSLGNFAQWARNKACQEPGNRSVLYTSPPGLEYQVDDGQRFNLRYLYRPSFTEHR